MRTFSFQKPVKFAPPGARGIDVSYYQGNIDWSAVAQAGVVFSFIKATEGTLTIDPQFHANWNGAHAAGLLRGAYHFYHPGADPHQQAEHFLNVAQIGPGDLPPVLDIETPGEASEIIAGIQVWLAAVEHRTGKTPILYTDPGFWATLKTPGFGRFPLWIAEYGVVEPTVPTGWSAWTFWQFSEAMSIQGIKGFVDFDVFQGTLSDLQRMASY